MDESPTRAHRMPRTADKSTDGTECLDVHQYKAKILIGWRYHVKLMHTLAVIELEDLNVK
jgi:hypothetical protein